MQDGSSLDAELEFEVAASPRVNESGTEDL